MPDLLSIGLGGGTMVTETPLSVGPRSVGFRLPEKALVFGGDTLTATDIGVAAGLISLGDAGRVRPLPRGLIDAVDRKRVGSGKGVSVRVDLGGCRNN